MMCTLALPWYFSSEEFSDIPSAFTVLAIHLNALALLHQSIVTMNATALRFKFWHCLPNIRPGMACTTDCEHLHARPVLSFLSHSIRSWPCSSKTGYTLINRNCNYKQCLQYMWGAVMMSLWICQQALMPKRLELANGRRTSRLDNSQSWP